MQFRPDSIEVTDPIDETNVDDIVGWAGRACTLHNREGPVLWMNTPEGPKKVHRGFRIAKNQAGEFAVFQAPDIATRLEPKV